MAVTNFIAEVWASQILVNFRQSTVLAPTMTDYSGEARIGNLVHVTAFNGATVHDYKSGGTAGARTITPDALTDTGLDIDLDHEKAFALLVDDIDRVQSAGSLGPVVADASAALIEDFESTLAALLMSAGTASGVTAPTDGQTAYQAVLNVRRQLSDAKVPAGDRFLAVNPKFAELLLDADSKLSAANTAGNPDGLRNATIGSLLGFQVVETALLNNSKASFAAYHRSAMGWVSQIDNLESIRDPQRFADIVRGLHVYGATALRAATILTYAAA